MNILQVNTLDSVGGAARIAWTLHNGFRTRGRNAWMAVGQKLSEDQFVRTIPVASPAQPGKLMFQLGRWIFQKNTKAPGKKNIGRFLQNISKQPYRRWNNFWGIEEFEYPGTWDLLKLPGDQPDIVHLHNLHGNYFDLSYLPFLSRQRPTIVTLHDAWLLSGHCAHSIDCERWKSGCGHCPYLNTNPPVKRDSTAYNWRRKKKIYRNSRIYVVSPSQWLLNKVNESILSVAARQSRVIHNGIDLSVFYPMGKTQARDSLQLPQDAFVCLFVATGPQDNVYKDYDTIQKALELVSTRWKGRKILFIALGGNAGISRIGNIEIVFAPFVSRPELVAKYYQAADIYLHAARADTFPNVILEAMACGTPVIATGVGGIPEQISDGQTGFVTPGADPGFMALRIIELLGSENLRKQMEVNAAITAKAKFSLDRMVEDYLAYYEEVIQDWQSRK